MHKSVKTAITGTLAEDFVVEEFVGRACGVVRRSNGDIGGGIFRFDKTCVLAKTSVFLSVTHNIQNDWIILKCKKN